MLPPSRLLALLLLALPACGAPEAARGSAHEAGAATVAGSARAPAAGSAAAPVAASAAASVAASAAASVAASVPDPACDAAPGDRLRATCADLARALSTGDPAPLLAHAHVPIHAERCDAQGTCARATYEDRDELALAIRRAGGVRPLFGLDATAPAPITVQACPQCRNNQLITVCTARAAGQPACAAAEGATLRALNVGNAALDPDADGDGLGELADRCPGAAEAFDGREDADGCPEGGPRWVGYHRVEERITLLRPLEFAGDTANLTPPSLDVVRQVAHFAAVRSDLAIDIHVHIEADPRACMAVTLAEHRARAIEAALIAGGVERGRVRAVPTTGGGCKGAGAPPARIEQRIDLYGRRTHGGRGGL